MDYKHEIYTAEEITEMCDTWANYWGHTGETCGKCRKTANVFAGGAGWHCECGHYNCQSWSCSNTPFEFPDMGTPMRVLRKGHSKSVKWNKILGIEDKGWIYRLNKFFSGVWKEMLKRTK